MGTISNGLPYNSRQRNLVAVTTFCLVISTIAVALRLLARRRFNIQLWWDDYIAVVALIFSYFPNVLTIMGVRAGLGRHVTEITREGSHFIGVTVYVHQMTWYISFTAIVITILILYIRIFPLAWLQRTSRGAGYFSAVWMIINLIVLTFQCTPVEYFWKHDRPGGGHCIRANDYYAITCAISMVMLILVFLLPLPIIRKLHITRQKKWGLGLAFTVGAFACVASVMRLVLVLDITPPDLAWSIAPAILWGCLETSIGVVSACLPSMMPLFISIFGKKSGNQDGESRGYLKYDNGNNKPSTNRTNRFRRFMTTRGLDPLPEALDLSSIKDTLAGDEDDVRLVEGTKKPGEILVTNQIHVSQEDPKPLESNPSVSNTWEAHAPPTAHLR